MFRHCKRFPYVSPLCEFKQQTLKLVNGVYRLVVYEHEPTGYVDDYSLSNLVSAGVPIKESNFESSSSLRDFDTVNSVAQKILMDDETKNAEK